MVAQASGGQVPSLIPRGCSGGLSGASERHSVNVVLIITRHGAPAFPFFFKYLIMADGGLRPCPDGVETTLQPRRWPSLSAINA
jgi:hypothetical protein